MSNGLPATVATALAGSRGLTVTGVHEERLDNGSGAASAETARLHVSVSRGSGDESQVSIIKKRLAPSMNGRPLQIESQRHWAYWPREAEAYQSDILPAGPGLRAPRCLGTDGTDIFLEDVRGPAPSIEEAAGCLAAWQADFDPALDRPWLAMNQLRDRISVAELDWSSVDADSRVVDIWQRRQQMLDVLAGLPVVRSHGDYCLANLTADGPDTVAFDWATFGWETVGFDLAHLALSAGQDPRAAYMAASPGHRDPDTVDTGFRSCVALIGISRLHWMLRREIPIPAWYGDLLDDVDAGG